MSSTVIVRYGELALKSEPVRRRFERTLIESIENALGDIRHSIRTERGRIFIDTSSAARTTKILSRIPGITSLSPAVRTNASLDAIKIQAAKIAKKVLSQGMTFAIRTSRTGEHAFSSREVNVEVGSLVLSLIKGTKVDLSHPDVEISIEVRGNDAYVFSSTIRGVGGLPVGTQGKVLAILSGSMNDAAAFLMLKRGCKVTPLFFDTTNRLSHPATKRVILQAKRLSLFGADDHLWVFPFRKILGLIQEKTDEKTSFFIRRRCELRAAEIVARKTAAEAIVTGDDAELIEGIMLTNLNAIDGVCKLAVLRPLSCMEEDEIKEICEKIGLKHANRALPHQAKIDVAINIEELLKLEKILNVEKIIDDASKKTKRIKVG